MTLEWLRTGGGPLPTPIGDALVAQGVRLLNGWGTYVTPLIYHRNMRR
jgi:long-subunit acyl-CoA synthetase (AMP-forming)